MHADMGEQPIYPQQVITGHSIPDGFSPDNARCRRHTLELSLTLLCFTEEKQLFSIKTFKERIQLRTNTNR